MTHQVHYAYLHGFASSPRSKKGVALAAAFAERGLALDMSASRSAASLELLDLNRPSFGKLTLSAQLEEVGRWAADKERVALIGSSMGGWVTSRFAEQNISKIEKIVLLAPGFEMVSRWPKLVGAQGMAAWRAHGALPFPDADKVPTPVHWGFLEDALTLPTSPAPAVPTLVIHGTGDDVVPIETSRAWVAAHPRPDLVRLIEVDDDHQLTASTARITSEVFDFFDLTPSTP